MKGGGNMKLAERFQVAIPQTTKVAIWVFVSAGLTALLSWALQKPELIQYYGLINILLYFLKELKKPEK